MMKKLHNTQKLTLDKGYAEWARVKGQVDLAQAEGWAEWVWDKHRADLA